MSIIDTSSESARGVEVVDSDQQSLTSTGTCSSAMIWWLRSRTHIESTGRMASEVHFHVHLASADRKLADPMAAGLCYQRQTHVSGHLGSLGEAPNGG
jgi:hypothetical protein